jgi:pimeloyl-ACP methyl ester carboxylesterase
MRVRGYVLAAVLAVMSVAVLVTCGLSRDEHSVHCRTATVPVTLSTTDSAVYRLAGWLCAAGSPRGRPVEVLVHGLTYQHTYWDWPYQPQRYSYVRAAAAAGYATFSVDRLGVGASDAPPADALTVPAQAFVLSQVVQKLKAGTIAGTRFGTVIGVGHSGGAAMWAYQAATERRPDARVDAVILAGFLHETNPAQVAAIGAALYPVENDRAFAGRGLPAGYLTTVPGTRARLFHNPSYVDPRVVAVDEASKATTTTAERASLALARDPELTRQIGVPVLVATGERDLLGCDPGDPGLSCADETAVMARESRYFSPVAHMQVYVQPQAGHDTNLAPNASDWFCAANRWAAQWVGGGGRIDGVAVACVDEADQAAD